MLKTTTNYEKHSNKNPIQQFLINRFYEKLFEIIKPLKPNSVLDAGAGEGFTLVKLARCKIGKRVEGVDNSERAVKIGKKMYPGLNLIQGDIYNLPYKDNSFDIVLCTEVLEHLEDPGRALEELKRVTKKYIMLTVPNEPFFRLANFFRGKYISNFGNHPEHINLWTSHSFVNFVKSKKLRISSKKYSFPWTLILARKQ